MHEARVMRDIVKAVVARTLEEGGSRVIGVELAFEPSSHLTEAVVRQHFSALAADTIAHEARVTIATVPGAYVCVACLHTFKSLEREAACPRCGGLAMSSQSHDSCHICAIDVGYDDDVPLPAVEPNAK